MASFVPHHTKKRERLARLEQDLLRSIRGDTIRATRYYSIAFGSERSQANPNLWFRCLAAWTDTFGIAIIEMIDQPPNTR